MLALGANGVGYARGGHEPQWLVPRLGGMGQAQSSERGSSRFAEQTWLVWCTDEQLIGISLWVQLLDRSVAPDLFLELGKRECGSWAHSPE